MKTMPGARGAAGLAPCRPGTLCPTRVFQYEMRSRTGSVAMFLCPRCGAVTTEENRVGRDV